MWVTEVGQVKEGLDWIEGGGKHGQLSAAFWGWVKEVGWWVSKPNRAASHTARLRLGQEAGVGAGPESHGRGVDGFVG